MTPGKTKADNTLHKLLQKKQQQSIVSGVDRISTDRPRDNAPVGLLHHLGVEDARDN